MTPDSGGGGSSDPEDRISGRDADEKAAAQEERIRAWEHEGQLRGHCSSSRKRMHVLSTGARRWTGRVAKVCVLCPPL